MYNLVKETVNTHMIRAIVHNIHYTTLGKDKICIK
jgi:hypothetical protein